VTGASPFPAGDRELRPRFFFFFALERRMLSSFRAPSRSRYGIETLSLAARRDVKSKRKQS
jgi:hypothetical protein